MNSLSGIPSPIEYGLPLRDVKQGIDGSSFLNFPCNVSVSTLNSPESPLILLDDKRIAALTRTLPS